MQRRLGALALASILVLAGCSSADEPASQETSASSAGWTYVSGDGKTYTADAVPTRIIAHAYAAKALMSYGITPIAIYADGPIDGDVGLKGADFDGVEILSEEWGVINVEKASTLKPDLIVGDWWPAEDAYSGFEGGVEEASKKMADLAPVVGPSQGDSIVGLVDGYAELAASLGADTSIVDQQRADFDTALTAFKAATAAKPDLDVLAISPWEDTYAVAVPKYAPELLDLQSWGLDVIDPTTPDADFPYWESLSFENADTYQPDVLLYDDRNYPGNADTLAKQPIAASIKAFAADSTTTWPAYWLHTYPDYTAQLERLTTFVDGADETIGD
ncbi:ABC transporter substrate-binding protein [Cellulomonas sp. PhB150]|uniref:ABC transporter substrate-binding protein n=1 Tax=Cellulomonas sp. PhB150 TaxID=2485188 RepID=UPI000F461E3E|nr:ABC transporter substrate-binding protein [Cellulomonas sp. PhB150]ROS28028.1 iron complex transport system substrate-binding protein [Cellulomonas sp. PhB150]